MENTQQLIFPELIEANEFGGNFQNYFKAVYAIFENDFIKSQPEYEGLKVSAQKHPEVEGIHRTFYHITHEGEDEAERTPDYRRMERIRFPKFFITNNEHSEILIWENTRGRDTRVLLFNYVEGYIVILTKREGYYLFWTAYLVQQEHRKNKLLKEYETYIKAKTAQRN
jgi:hypothetical protein